MLAILASAKIMRRPHEVLMEVQKKYTKDIKIPPAWVLSIVHEIWYNYEPLLQGMRQMSIFDQI